MNEPQAPQRPNHALAARLLFSFGDVEQALRDAGFSLSPGRRRQTIRRILRSERFTEALQTEALRRKALAAADVARGEPKARLAAARTLAEQIELLVALHARGAQSPKLPRLAWNDDDDPGIGGHDW